MQKALLNPYDDRRKQWVIQHLCDCITWGLPENLVVLAPVS